MKILETSNLKSLSSPTYHYLFDKKHGTFIRYGESFKDDPTYCPFGPEILDIELSTICHKACSWCYKSNTAKGHNMSLETYKELFSKFPKSLTQIAFGIGDIDSNPDLFKIMEYTRERGIIPNITINGERLTDEICNKLSSLCGAVAVSAYGDLRICFGAIKKLTDLGMKQVNIHKLLAYETYDQCMNLLYQAKDHPEVNAIVFLWVKPKGERNLFRQLPNKTMYKTLVDYALDNQVKIGFDSCSATMFLDAIKKRKGHRRLEQLVEPCESTCFSFYIDVNGIGWPCSFCGGLPKFSGLNVLHCNDFITDIWNHPETISFREGNIKCNGKCQPFKLGF
jgi:MoaA/NifB/PqqE/SkfB family radical SAM enzyme